MALITSASACVSFPFLLVLVFIPSNTWSQTQLGSVSLPEPHVTIFQVYDTQNDMLLVDKPPNSTVTFSKDIGKVVFVCVSSKEPVTWEYFVNGINFSPLLEQSFSRTIQQSDLLVDGDSGYLFHARVTLRGLLESQSGLYTCKHTNQKEQSQSNNISSSVTARLEFDRIPNFFDIRIPGSHVFLDERNEIEVHPNDQSIDIWCQTSNPNFEVTLWKAVPYNGNLLLEPILANSPLLKLHGKLEYEDLVQQQIKHGLFSLKNGNDSFGRYICTARDKNYTVDVKPWNSNENGSIGSDSQDPTTIYPNPNFIRILRLKRRRCACSLEPDISEMYDISKNAALALLKDCHFWKNASTQNWKLAEFYNNGEENCLTSADNKSSEINWPSIRKDETGSWSQLTILCHEHGDFNFTNLTITFYGFYGFDDQLARGFRIGVQTLRRNGGLSSIEYLNQTPYIHSDTNTIDEPGEPAEEWNSNLGLMKYVWKMSGLNVTRIHRVHLALPYKYSMGWKTFVASFVNDLPHSKFIYKYTTSNLVRGKQTYSSSGTCVGFITLIVLCVTSLFVY